MAGRPLGLSLPFAHKAAFIQGSDVGDIINLRHARKRRDKTAASRVAEENRAKFGRTKAERLTQQAEAERLANQVEGARRDDRGKIEDSSEDSIA